MTTTIDTGNSGFTISVNPNMLPVSEVSDKSWSDFSASDYDIAQWRRACLIKPAEQTDSKGDYKLPVREPNGTLNRNGVHAAAAALAGARGGVSASADQKKKAASSLVSMYRNQLKENPPGSLLKAAGQSGGDSKESEESEEPEFKLHNRKELTEATELPIEEARRTGVFEIVLITPGWGSSGYYSESVLQEAANNRVFAAGTHQYLDHPTETENAERPARSVKDLVGVLKEDAYWNGKGIVAKAEVYSQWRDALAEMKDAIGVSVRAYAQVSEGTAEGRPGVIIDKIDEAVSVDFVTHAGRGGKILEVLESKKEEIEEKRNLGDWFEARLHSNFTQIADDFFGNGQLSREDRIALSAAIGDSLTTFNTSLKKKAKHLYERDIYAGLDEDFSHQSGGDKEKEGKANMPQIEEARLRQLEEAEGKLPTLEKELSEEKTARTDAENALAVEKAKNYAFDYARKRVTEANSELPTSVVERIVSSCVVDIPLGEDKRLDTNKFNTAVDEARDAEEKYLASLYPPETGRVHGLGSHYEESNITEEDIAKATASVFGRELKGA